MSIWVRRIIRNTVRVLLRGLRGILGRFVPQDQRLILFGSGIRGFSDNARYLFEFVTATRHSVHAWWVADRLKDVRIVRALGFNVLWKYSPRTFFAALRARYFFVTHGVDDVYPVKGRRTVIVNLWHGSPIKKAGHDSDVDMEWIRRRKRLGLSLPYEQWDSIIVSHKTFVPIFQSAMLVPEEKLLPLGLPRNDVLMRVRRNQEEGDRIRRDVLNQIGVDGSMRILLYAPTFRDSSMGGGISDLLKSEAVQQILVDGNILLLCRFHPLSTEARQRDIVGGNVRDASGFDDVQKLLVAADGLVSDYSSIIFDYLILSRPTLLYLPDLKDYEKVRGGLYFDLQSLPFDRAVTLQEFLTWLSAFSKGTVKGREQEYLNYHVDGEASPRIAEYFLD